MYVFMNIVKVFMCQELHNMSCIIWVNVTVSILFPTEDLILGLKRCSI